MKKIERNNEKSPTEMLQQIKEENFSIFSISLNNFVF